MSQLLGPRVTGSWGHAVILTVVALTACQPLEYQCLRDESEVVDRSDSSGSSVVVVAVDGFRHDYQGHFPTPALDSIRKRGVVVNRLVPVFPTETAPNFTSMVTGEYPETHGILGNVFLDTAHDAVFARDEQPAPPAGEQWKFAKPIWQVLRNEGLTSASLDWPRVDRKSEAPGPHVQCSGRPWSDDEWKISKALDLLRGAGDVSPDLILLHLPMVDAAGHRTGPDGEEVQQAVRRVDELVGRLLHGIETEASSSPTHVVILSDHGMARRNEESRVLLDDYLDLSAWELVTSGAYSALWKRSNADGMSPQRLQVLNEENLPIAVYAGDEIPRRLHYRGSRRTPDVLILAEEGAVVGTRDNLGHSGEGLHGYEPSVRRMHGSLLATGPKVRRSERIPTASMVDVYALLLRLFELKVSESVAASSEPFEDVLCREECSRPQ